MGRKKKPIVRRGPLGVDASSTRTAFDHAKLRLMEGYRKRPDNVQVCCGCTSRKYGDTMGRLKVTIHGQFLIFCLCRPDCKKRWITPDEFEVHSNREGNKKWSSHIWVRIDGRKVPIKQTCLLKYYRHNTNVANAASMARRKKRFHRDEFMQCTGCNKMRRFKQRNVQQRWSYHYATLEEKWMCDKHPSGKLTCNDEEERQSRQLVRGCPSSASCRGCTKCVCFGCLRCRYIGCTCRTCTEFVQYAEP